MGLWAYAIRELVRRRGRSLITLLGIAVGVTAAVAAYSAIQFARGSYEDLFDGLAGEAALEVYAPGEAGFDPAPTGVLGRAEGVLAALPEVQGTAARPGWDAPVPVLVRAKKAHTGDRVPRDGEVFVPPGLAASARLGPGERFRLWGPAGQSDLVVAVSPPRSETTRSAADEVVTVSLRTAQHIFGLGDKVNLVRLILIEGTDARLAEAAVAHRLPAGLAVRAPSSRADVARGLRAAASQGLTGLTAIALAGAGYVVFGIAQVSLHSRYRELALLRTLGASVRQVEGLLLRQALLLGAGGGLLGTTGGLLLAAGIAAGTNAAMGLGAAPSPLGIDYVLLGTGTGVWLSVVAVWLPARSLCRQPPLVLARAGAVGGSGTPPAGNRPGPMFCLAVGVLTLTACATGRIAPAAGEFLFTPALVLTLAGTTLVIAPAFPGQLRRLERPTRFVFGVCGVLAIRQLGRRPERTSRTAGVVFVTVAMSIGFGHSLLNTLADVRRWTEHAIPADLLVRGSMPDPGFVLISALPEKLGAELRRCDGVDVAEQIAFIPTRVNGEPALLLARTFAPGRPLALDLRGADPAAIRPALASGETVLANGLARTLRTHVGDVVRIDTPTGSRPVRVAGTANEYAAGGAALYLDWDAAQTLFGPSSVHVFLVTAHANRRGEAEAAVAAFCSTRGLLLQKNEELRRVIDGLTHGLTGGLWALLAVMFVVAGLGIVSALAVTSGEQAQDTEVLRAVGMTAAELRRAFRIQALLLTVTGLPGGILCGIGLALALNRSIAGLWGHSVPFHLQVHLLVGVLAITVLITSVMPALVRLQPAAR